MKHVFLFVGLLLAYSGFAAICCMILELLPRMDKDHPHRAKWKARGVGSGVIAVGIIVLLYKLLGSGYFV